MPFSPQPLLGGLSGTWLSGGCCWHGLGYAFAGDATGEMALPSIRTRSARGADASARSSCDNNLVGRSDRVARALARASLSEVKQNPLHASGMALAP